MLKQSLSLMIAPAIVGLYTGLANANEVKVQAGNMQVSVENGRVEVDSGSTKAPSLLDRLSNLRVFGNNRQASPRVHPSRSSNLKCDRNTTGYSTTRRNSSGSSVAHTRSSSTTMTCN